jgi:hypothetical protein
MASSSSCGQSEENMQIYLGKFKGTKTLQMASSQRKERFTSRNEDAEVLQILHHDALFPNSNTTREALGTTATVTSDISLKYARYTCYYNHSPTSTRDTASRIGTLGIFLSLVYLIFFSRHPQNGRKDDTLRCCHRDPNRDFPILISRLHCLSLLHLPRLLCSPFRVPEVDRKLDISLTPNDAALPDGEYDWSNAVVIGEHKQNPVGLQFEYRKFILNRCI